MHTSPRSPPVYKKDLTLSATKTKDVSQELSPNRKPQTEHSVSRFKINDRGSRVDMKLNFLSRVATPPKKTTAQNEIDALENAKFFIQAQSDKDRRTIKIRLAQMNKDSKINQQQKKLPVIDNVLGQSPTDALLYKYRSKELSSPEKTSHGPITLENRLESRSTLNFSTAPKSHSKLDSKGSPNKTLSEQEFQSLCLQKRQKSREASISPASTKYSSLNETGSINNIHTTRLAKSRIHRKAHSTSIWSANSLKSNADWQNAVDEIKVLSNKEIYSPQYQAKYGLLENDIDKDYLTSLANIDKGEDAGSSLNNVDNKKKSSKGCLAPSVRISSSGGFYAHLNEVKQRRTKLFKKPSRELENFHNSVENIGNSMTIVASNGL